MSLTYVYCIVRSLRRPQLSRVPPPVPGGDAVRAVMAEDGVWLIVSHVPATEYGESAVTRGLQDIEWVGTRALAHEAVVEQFLGARAVLPMQLFTLFISDERAVAHVKGHRRRIGRVLARVDRHVEWGVRVSFEDRPSATSGRRTVPGDAGGTGTRGRVETGAAYLSRKRDTLESSRTRLGRARLEGDRLYRMLARMVTAARRMTATEQAVAGSRLLVDAAFLVPIGKAAAFRTALKRKRRDLVAAGLAVTLTGPWPPYNFIGPPPRGR